MSSILVSALRISALRGAFATAADLEALPGVAVLRGFLSATACAELAHAANCLPAPGHAACVRAALLPLLARTAPGLLPPLLAARDAVREAAEALGLCGEASSPLFIEFSALLTWAAGAALGWHDDVSGGPHLAQRHVSAVLYLNDAGSDFGGGDFLCEPPGGGAARSFAPSAGTLLLYPSTLRHAVAPVTWGQRRTLAIWLTRDGVHDEDAALLGPGRPFDGRGQLTAESLCASAAPLEAVPDAFFCDAQNGGADARITQLAARGLRPADDEASNPLTLTRSADGTRLPVAFTDATHALRSAVFAEWARGAPLAAMDDAAAAEAAAAADAHELAGRAVVAALLPRWRAANALFGAD